jgi:hypothetical protein
MEGLFLLLLFIVAPIIIVLSRSGFLGHILSSIFLEKKETEEEDKYSYGHFFKNLCSNFGNPTEPKRLVETGSSFSAIEIEECDFSFQEHPVHLEFKNTERPEQLPAYAIDDQLTAFDISKQKVKAASDILEIRIPLKQKFWLRMFRQRLQEEDADEIQSGLSELDREYIIHTNQREAAEDFLRRTSVQKYLSKFPCTFDKLEIIQGQLSLTIHEPRTWQMNQNHLTLLLQNLLALIVEYQEHNIIILHISATKSEYRCPYCRNTFDENSGSIIQCKNCGTRLHEACWKENGQCTT